ncbi:nuclear transport factor 2 family protein [Actinomadura madurae]|uniref:nuclear transport factor 2 family protein n=1 Tax=Actinomadura madurae TaxID=1993 RepID=UPI0020261851|nr:nuclear transport factor 2 family protein [Actinomadura madurae]URN01174.1 nuclear transport factor 2 family protein [Actinomadura madurae]
MTSTIGSHVVDRIMISDLVTSLAYAQDERRWDLFPRIFTSRVVVDLSAHLGSPPQELAVEELAEGARNALEGFDTTNHVVSNIRIELEEDVAHCRAYVLAYHHLREAPGPVDYCSMRGNWQLKLVRTESGWRIRKWGVRRIGPIDGDDSLYEVAASRVSSGDVASKPSGENDLRGSRP